MRRRILLAGAGVLAVGIALAAVMGAEADAAVGAQASPGPFIQFQVLGFLLFFVGLVLVIVGAVVKDEKTAPSPPSPPTPPAP